MRNKKGQRELPLFFRTETVEAPSPSGKKGQSPLGTVPGGDSPRRQKWKVTPIAAPLKFELSIESFDGMS